MSLIISDIKTTADVTDEEAISNLKQQYDFCKSDGIAVHIYRTSIDARRHPVSIVRSFLVEGLTDKQADILCAKYKNLRKCTDTSLDSIISDVVPKHEIRPVVVGLGPAGMFAALTLARLGLRPVVIERGKCIAERDVDVELFKKDRVLNTESNIQFGEGGAGSYSDGKLTTRINDVYCSAVLREFVHHGAPSEILTRAHPHIGTDILKGCVSSINAEIQRLGGKIYWKTRFLSVKTRNGSIVSVYTSKGEIPCNRVILAIGHSARDTFECIEQNNIEIIPKNFAMGFRIEHLQSHVNEAVYGKQSDCLSAKYGAAEYAVSVREGDLGCFSFCMCPGGHVCASQSEPQTVVTNGMSFHARDGVNANAAIAVSVPTELFPAGKLGGVSLARQIEQKAYRLGGSDYSAPAQLVRDFLNNTPSVSLGSVKPTYPLGVKLTNLNALYPGETIAFMQRALKVFSRQFRFFNDGDALLTGPETRTSSPVRIPRETIGESVSLRGLFPCGEGAGYAGGIMSAAVDGIRQAINLCQN